MHRFFSIFLLLTLSVMVVACGKPPPVMLYEQRQSGKSNNQSFESIPQTGIYIVKRANSLYEVAQLFGLSSRAIIRANNLRPPYRLFIGQRLKLPAPRIHRVVKGDTLYGISRQYRVAMSRLAQLNGLKPPYKIIAGSRLRLPGAVESVQVARQHTPTTTRRSAPVTRPERGKTSRQVKPRATDRQAAVQIPKSAGGFIWPVRGRVISRFGAKGRGLHNDGVNVAAPRGTPVLAAQSGVVAYAGNQLRGFGNLVLIRHSNGLMTAYAHNERLLVAPGDTVRRGQRIAKVGSTGSVASPQLHFEVRSGRQPVDPVKFLRRNAAT